MKTIFSIIFTLIIVSCASIKISKENLIGNYKTKSNGMKLTLSNTTFKYTNSSSLYEAKSEGTWKLKGEDIILTSFPEFRNNLIEVEEIKFPKKRQVFIFDEDNRSYEGVVFTYIDRSNNKIFKTTDENGVIVLPKDLNIKYFTISYLGENHDYEVKNVMSSFKVKLYFDDLNRKYFDDEKVITKKNSLVLGGIKLSLQ